MSRQEEEVVTLGSFILAHHSIIASHMPTPPDQLLTCYSTAASASATLPPDALLISPLLGCPLGWQVRPQIRSRLTHP